MGQNRDMSRRLFLGAMLLAGYQLADPKVQAAASEDLGSWQQGEGGEFRRKKTMGRFGQSLGRIAA